MNAFSKPLKPKSIGMDEMRNVLRREIQAVGGMRAWCRKVGIEGHGSVSSALSGTRPVTEPIANALGYIAQTTFLKMEN